MLQMHLLLLRPLFWAQWSYCSHDHPALEERNVDTQHLTNQAPGHDTALEDKLKTPEDELHRWTTDSAASGASGPLSLRT